MIGFAPIFQTAFAVAGGGLAAGRILGRYPKAE